MFTYRAYVFVRNVAQEEVSEDSVSALKENSKDDGRSCPE